MIEKSINILREAGRSSSYEFAEVLETAAKIYDSVGKRSLATAAYDEAIGILEQTTPNGLAKQSIGSRPSDLLLRHCRTELAELRAK